MTVFDTSFLANPVMPWGMHKGVKLADIPNDYLLWLVEKADSDSLKPAFLNLYVRNEWQRRRTNPTTS